MGVSPLHIASGVVARPPRRMPPAGIFEARRNTGRPPGLLLAKNIPGESPLAVTGAAPPRRARLHLHVRNPETGRPSADPARFTGVPRGVKRRCQREKPFEGSSGDQVFKTLPREAASPDEARARPEPGGAAHVGV